jgi:hypothetical protein
MPIIARTTDFRAVTKELSRVSYKGDRGACCSRQHAGGDATGHEGGKVGL